MKRLVPAICAAVIFAAAPSAVAQSIAVPEARVDAVFATWSASTPGCAVGVARGGLPVLQKAYGMADLEHGVANTPETIFEAGSVSKQFTAAAVLLLAQDGKLSLDDPARKYLPELPDYGAPLTIRHMLQHTSGLRDWGEVASMAGWPRGSRVHTHAHVLDIVSRQTSLNFPSGTQYSYSNTGYNLAAVIVARVSGMSLAQFTRRRIFEPLGLTRTSWRDDFTRIVKDRAIAYAAGPSGFRTNMPFENVYGNGGLLTTVGDLLKWNENFVTGKVGGAAFIALQQEPGRFNDGRPHPYAMGLRVGEYNGVAAISHSGATAGYRAYLTRFPGQHLSVAVLCNAASGSPAQAALKVATLYLGNAISAAPVVEEDDADAVRRATPEFTPSAADLDGYLGTYESDEVQAAVQIVRDGGTLVMTRRPDTRTVLRPVARDAFDAGGRTVTFRRDAGGAVTALSLGAGRVFDMRFRRASAVSSAGMTAIARGTFDVKMGMLAFENAAEGASLSRMSLDKTFHGDLDATGAGQMLAAGTAVKDSAAYAAIEQVRGTLHGRKGTFVLHHTGTMTRGAPSLAISVVPDSGTGELAGLSGTMTIRIDGGNHFYEFTYTLAR
ncbi:MAG: serine hydrolase [Acidobacteriota bacterium]|nr:serine hydrolase [Acidobacteriota bacterium]